MSNRNEHGRRILVVADPGIPTRRFQVVQERFVSRLEERLGVPVSVYVRSALVETWPDGALRLSEAAALRSEYDEVDLVLVLTEMPRHARGKLLVAELFPDHDVATFYWPTLGVLATRRRLIDVFTACTERLTSAAPWPEEGEHLGYGYRWTRVANSLALRCRPVTGAPRTVIGMVVTNAPWRTVPKLSGALAAASATGAFGVFYSSIWQMSASLSTLRLLVIAMLAMAAMVAWLLFGHRLWDRGTHGDPRGPTLIYNLSTIATLFLCVLVLYIALAAVILAASLVVISPDFMQQILQEKATFSNYLGIAWLSASLGVVAGGLGASFDSETDLRQLTHSRRERLRERDDEPPEEGRADRDR